MKYQLVMILSKLSIYILWVENVSKRHLLVNLEACETHADRLGLMGHHLCYQIFM